MPGPMVVYRRAFLRDPTSQVATKTLAPLLSYSLEHPGTGQTLSPGLSHVQEAPGEGESLAPTLTYTTSVH